MGGVSKDRALANDEEGEDGEEGVGFGFIKEGGKKMQSVQ